MSASNFIVLFKVIFLCSAFFAIMGGGFYLLAELFFYIFYGIEMTFSQSFWKFIHAGLVGGGIMGVGLWLMAYFSQQYPKR